MPCRWIVAFLCVCCVQDFFGKSDPYLVFSRKNHDGSFSAVHKSPVIKNTLDPDWQPFVVTSQKLCNGDDNREIQVSTLGHENRQLEMLAARALLGCFRKTLHWKGCLCSCQHYTSFLCQTLAW